MDPRRNPASLRNSPPSIALPVSISPTRSRCRLDCPCRCDHLLSATFGSQKILARPRIVRASRGGSSRPRGNWSREPGFHRRGSIECRGHLTRQDFGPPPRDYVSSVCLHPRRLKTEGDRSARFPARIVAPFFATAPSRVGSQVADRRGRKGPSRARSRVTRPCRRPERGLADFSAEHTRPTPFSSFRLRNIAFAAQSPE